ncbi:MAG TPA: EAL domain-containing protein [Noviherbaspirillum sp.]|nr:EAL domain-containing protein [Noviherbaspirillum sp.]
MKGENVNAMKLSDFIRANIEPILVTWEQFAKSISITHNMSTAALRDHASGILYAIASDLDRAQTPHEQAEKSKGRGPRSAKETYAALHGAARESAGFNVLNVISEFRALRASVVRLWTGSHPTALHNRSDELTRFNEAIDQALTESLERYTADLVVDLERYTHLFDTLLSSSPDLNFICDIEGRIIYANQSLANSFDMSTNEMVGKNLIDLGASNAAELQQELQRVIDTKETYRGEMSATLPSGKEETFEYLYVPVMNTAGAVEAIAGMARDLTERKASEEKIRRSANYDSLTGLPNRNLFLTQLEMEVKRSVRTGLPFALFFIDLDGFKEVNDQLGHAAGDLLLQQVAQRLSACVRGTDTVARLGGDEFTVILSDVNKVAHVEILAEEILEKLAIPFLILQKEVHISGSIGITLFPQDAITPENLVRNADQAMYVAKNAGRNRFSFFAIGMRESAWARLKVIEELRHALPQHQLAVYYQPIVDLSVEGIVKAEALLRWHHPQTGLMLPDDFIGLAEETGLIGEIGEWVLEEAMMRAREWSILLGVPFQISVNKSPAEFMSKTSMKNWAAHLAALGLARDSIAVEITEGILLIDSPSVREKLDNLQKAGVQLAIDDFGTGYSSMAYLKKFDVDYLKIDQSFVQDTATNMDSRTIAETIIVMAHKLGLKVIAEGVETIEQRDWLKAAQCDYAQGYFYSEPVSSHDFEKLLRSGKAQYQAPVQH